MNGIRYRTPRWPGRRLTPLAVAAATALAGALVAAPAAQANASPPTAEAALPPALDTGVPGSAAEVMAAAYLAANPDLSVAAARAAAAAQENAEDLKAGVLEHPDTFGGAWFDPYTAQFHVAVTTPQASSQVARLAAESGVAVRTHRVERTFDELWEQAEELRRGTSRLARVADQQVGIDVRANQVVVAVPAEQIAASDRQAPPGVALVPAPDQQAVPAECISRIACDDSLRAGLRTRLGLSGSLMNCSAGFTARSSNGTRFLLTAGHCSGLGNTIYTGNLPNMREIGPYTTAIDSGVIDVGAIAVTNPFYANTSSGRIWAAASSVGATAPWLPVNGAVQSMSQIWAGQVVCSSANVPEPWAGNPCGQVTSVSDPGLRGMVRVEGPGACQGESGGGVYQLTGSQQRTAAGVVALSPVGFGERCVDGAEGNTAYAFSPLPAWSFWNLQYEIG